MDHTPEESIDALGALCEIAGFMYRQLIKNGFPEERAYNIAAEYILNTLIVIKQEDETDE